jgi:hypothetical protein
MPASQPPRPDRSARAGSAGGPARGADLAAIPAFLRDPRTSRKAAAQDAPDASTGAGTGLAIPRPSTPAPTAPASPATPRLDPASLPMPSLSRRRVVTAAGVLLAGLLALSFARQVGEATAASQRADELRAGNAALRDEVASLERDLGHVQDPRFIELQGREFGLGGRREIPFALAADAPALAADAPGSAAVRLGAAQQTTSPLDAWLEILFGTGR